MSKHHGTNVGDFEQVQHIQLEPLNQSKSLIDALMNYKKNSSAGESTTLKIVNEHFPYILELCKKYPNDMELGNKLREYLKNI